MDYISLNCTDHNYGRETYVIAESRDPHALTTATEIVHLIEYLCTI